MKTKQTKNKKEKERVGNIYFNPNGCLLSGSAQVDAKARMRNVCLLTGHK